MAVKPEASALAVKPEASALAVKPKGLKSRGKARNPQDDNQEPKNSKNSK